MAASIISPLFNPTPTPGAPAAADAATMAALALSRAMSTSLREREEGRGREMGEEVGRTTVGRGRAVPGHSLRSRETRRIRDGRSWVDPSSVQQKPTSIAAKPQIEQVGG